jgi:hypothetical protein
MDLLQGLELDKLHVDDHIEAIKFYSYLKFRRMIEANIKTEIESQLKNVISEVLNQVQSIK